MYLQLSWRNLWRNKRRTIISAASVFFAVFLALLMRSAQHGSYAYMIDSSAKLYTGHAQLQQKDYWDNQSLDSGMELPDSLIREIAFDPAVSMVTPRLESFALLSGDTLTQVAQVVGIDPQKEAVFTGLDRRLQAGNFLTSDDQGALVAVGLAEMLQVTVGDTIILYGQGCQGMIAADQCVIRGLVKLPFEIMNNSLVFLSLPRAREIFFAWGRTTSVAILYKDIRHLLKGIAATEKMIDTEELSVLPWNIMLPELEQNILVDNASGLIMLSILYIVVTFGILGTVMMMVSERTREYAILLSVGMSKLRLISVTALESFGITLLGLVPGSLTAWPLLDYLSKHPIPITGAATKTFDSLGIEPVFNFSTNTELFFGQMLIVFSISMAVAIYPVLYIRKLNPVKAARE